MARVVAAVKVGEEDVVIGRIAVVRGKHVARCLYRGHRHIVRSEGRDGGHRHRVLTLDQKITGPIVGVMSRKAIVGGRGVECLSALAMATDELSVAGGRRTKLY